jgi:hypothetical protein
MKRQSFIKTFLFVLAAIFLIGSVDTFGQRRTVTRRPVLRRHVVTKRPITPGVKLYAVDRGTNIHVRMNSTISSKTARVGDRFTTTVTEPVYSSTGAVVIPSGSAITGRVDSVRPAAKGGNPGQIDVHFVEVRTPNGTRRAINGSLTDLNSDKTRSDVEGTATGSKMQHRKVIFIGGGAAGGAILGAAIGGGKGALIGGLLGAGGGFLGEKYTKGKDAEVNSGTEFGVILNQAISLPKFAEINP